MGERTTAALAAALSFSEPSHGRVRSGMLNRSTVTDPYHGENLVLMLQLFLVCALLGIVAGLLGGALGLGGGAVIVPALLLIFNLMAFDPTVVVHMAIATSLGAIVATAISATRTHLRQNNLRWPLAIPLMVGVSGGALLGAVVADYLPGDVLVRFFGIFLILVAVQMFSGRKISDQDTAHSSLPGKARLVISGVLIGILSAMFGIGGGSITVPLLTHFRVIMREAVAVSAACGLPIALFGCLGFIITGWNNPALPPGSIGYVYMPALLGIASTSYFFARQGALLAQRLPAQLLRQIFAVVLLLVGLRLVMT